jgi:signal transduction histidine kinase
MGDEALQSVSSLPASAEAVALTIDLLSGSQGVVPTAERIGEHLATLDGVDLVAISLVMISPPSGNGWVTLGGRASLREWQRPGTSCSVAPSQDGTAEQANSLPWLSPTARRRAAVVVDIDQLPPEADQDRRELADCGVRAVITRSVARDNVLYCGVAIARESSGPWPAAQVADVELLATALADRIAAELSHRSLVDAVERADEAHESKEQFFAALGHELRTPIAAIMGTAELLGEDARERAEADASGFSASVSRDADIVLRAAEQLHAVVEDLLGTGRELGGGAETQWVDVAEAIADVVHWLQTPARTAEVRVESAVPPGVRVRTTPSALRQILTNLVGNAIAYNVPGGSVRIGATRAIDEFGRPRVRIGVRDTGPGLTPEQQREVFKPFVRFAVDDVRGTGLGLSLSRSLAERDGGLMGVESSPGAGSSFWLDLASTSDDG